VVLLRWEKDGDDKSERLVVVDEFHSFCRPTFNTTLHPFCTELTGITQVRMTPRSPGSILTSTGSGR
jgi:hypothetical protein